ncbi:MAG: phosphoribosylglycinamide formyltransferase [Bacteroidales bacterium]|nr:phosphoribosylglycinamide formyltransferase [Bacteroidales bacterium]
MEKPIKNLAVFASGAGTNAENLIKYFSQSDTYRVTVVFCNRKDAYVLERAKKLDIPSIVFNREQLTDGTVGNILKDHNIYAVILAGFLMMVPEYLIREYEGRIINIHPALLPAYGGKGMHGMHVHNAVVAAGERESGITVHIVDEQYDHGKTIFQARCKVEPTDSPDDVAAKIHLLEQAYFPQAVDNYLRSLI